jgi:hypothetical protein
MPYLIGKTDEISKGLLLRHWAVPYEVIAEVLGRNAMYWARAEESLGRLSIVGSLHKKGQLAEHLAADEKITFLNGKETYLALTSSKDCVLGRTADAGRFISKRRYRRFTIILWYF